MMTLTNRYMVVLIALYALIFSSCTKEICREDQEATAICLTVDATKTKASIFDSPASLNNPEVGGGDFAVYAIHSGTGQTFMNNVRVNYFPDANDWRFTDNKGNYVNYYWPLGNEKLDFFGHFPLDPQEAGVSEVSYTYQQPSFTFSLPLHSYDASAARNEILKNSNTPNQEGLREFMYSYVPGQSKENQNADPNNPGIKMNFSHPFAAVSFRLGKSYRMTLHDITINNIKNAGTYIYNNGWSIDYTEESKTLWIDIEKGIPTPINFNSPIGGPYLVAPQDLTDDSFLGIAYTRLDSQKETKSVQLNTVGTTKWEAGKHYVYTLEMGNNEEEILFKVQVEKWTVMDHKNEIDVE